MAFESTISQHISAGKNNRLLIAFSVLLVLSLYINLTKVFLGDRYYILLIDVALFIIGFRVIIYRLFDNLSFTKIELLATLFLVIGVAEIFNPNIPTMMVGIEGFRRVMFQMLAIFVGVAAVKDRSDLIRVIKLITLCSLPILLYGIKQFFFLSDFDYAIINSNTAGADTWRIFGKTRAFGIFNGPFHLGLFSGLVFWLAIASHFVTKRKFYLFVAFVAVLACVASLTRSSIIALFASFPVVLFYTFNKYRIRVFFITFLIVGFTFAMISLLRYNFETIDFFFNSISNVENVMDSNRFTNRFGGYEHALANLKSHPFGLGMGSSADAMDYYFEAYDKVHITSHNLFLRIGLETGWIGLLLFLGIVCQLFATIRTFKKRREPVMAIILLGPLMIIMIAGITGSTLGAYPINLIFWSLCGMVVAVSGTLRRRG